MTVTQSFRDAMRWFHTWAGVALSAVLFAMFFMGTLSVFDKEIDQWMKPEQRTTSAYLDLDESILRNLKRLDIKAGSSIYVDLPSERIPNLITHYKNQNGGALKTYISPTTGQIITPTDSLAGTGFIFPFHYMLHLPGMMGYWIVGLAAIAMLVLIVSGIFIHRKIFSDFFTFRPDRKLRRSTLDMHNLTSLIALPFHILFPFTGIIILITTYLPWSVAVPYGGDIDAVYADLYGEGFVREAAGEPGAPLASLDALIDKAEELWRSEHGDIGATAYAISIGNYGDATAYIDVMSWAPKNTAGISYRNVYFDAASGDVLGRFEQKPLQHIAMWLEGAHWIAFDHWVLRWLFFFFGLSGCVMIASGLLFWMWARINRDGPEPVKVRAIRGLTVGATTGIILATGAFLIANRLLPNEASFADLGRAELEVWAFFMVWIGAFLHAAIRDKAAWIEQALAISIFTLIAVLLNWITTGDHLVESVRTGLWSVAGMDLVLMATSAVAALSAYRLRKTERVLAPLKKRTRAAERIAAE